MKKLSRAEFDQRLRDLGLPAGAPFCVRRSQLAELTPLGLTEALISEYGGEVIEDEQAAAEDDLTIICVSAARRYFPDNVFRVCAGCGAGIQHRPNVPANARLICFKCAAKELEDQGIEVVQHKF